MAQRDISLKQGAPSVPSVERALSVFELLADAGRGMSMAEIMRALGLPRSSTHCLLLTLERCGYIQRNHHTGRYQFGVKLFNLARTALDSVTLREVARPFLRRLMQRTGLTVHLAILDRYAAILIEKMEPAARFKLATWVGRQMDVHCTSTGKILIANLPEEELDRLIQRQGLPRHNENTIASPRKLKEHLARVRELGYAVDDEEDELGFRCIGRGVFDEHGNVIAAISAAGSIAEMTQENMREITRELREAAMGLSSVLGYRGRTSATPAA